MREITQDEGCVIVERSQEGVVYQADDGDRWIIHGICNGCGVCDGDFPHAGPPQGRLDIPIRPEGPPTWPGCVLSGEYL